MAKEKIQTLTLTIDEGTTLIDENGVSYIGTVTVDATVAEKLKSTGKAQITEAIPMTSVDEITPAQILEEALNGNSGK